MFRIARKILVTICAVFAVFGSIAAMAGTAAAETPSVSSSPYYTILSSGIGQYTYNTVETFGTCFDQGTDVAYQGTCTNGYDGIDQATEGWNDNCYQPDCGAIVVTPAGVSTDKRADMHFVVGNYGYQYLDASTGLNIYVSGTWNNAKQTLAFVKNVTVGGVNYKLQLTAVNAYYNRDGLPLPTFQPCTDICKGGGGMK